MAGAGVALDGLFDGYGLVLPERLAKRYNEGMGKAEILAELPRLSADELAEVQAKLDEIAGEVWLDGGELSDADKAALDAALAEYRANPEAGSSWPEVLERIQAKLRP